MRMSSYRFIFFLERHYYFNVQYKTLLPPLLPAMLILTFFVPVSMIKCLTLRRLSLGKCSDVDPTKMRNSSVAKSNGSTSLVRTEARDPFNTAQRDKINGLETQQTKQMSDGPRVPFNTDYTTSREIRQRYYDRSQPYHRRKLYRVRTNTT